MHLVTLNQKVLETELITKLKLLYRLQDQLHFIKQIGQNY